MKSINPSRGIRQDTRRTEDINWWPMPSMTLSNVSRPSSSLLKQSSDQPLMRLLRWVATKLTCSFLFQTLSWILYEVKESISRLFWTCLFDKWTTSVKVFFCFYILLKFKKKILIIYCGCSISSKYFDVRWPIRTCQVLILYDLWRFNILIQRNVALVNNFWNGALQTT